MVRKFKGVTPRAQEQRGTAPELVAVQEAPRDDVLMKDAALKRKIMKVPKSGGVAENSDDQIRDSVLKIRKIRDSILREEFILQDRSAQCDMDIQKIKKEEKMTTGVLSSMMDKYKQPSSNIMKVANLAFSGDDGITKSTRRMELSLKEALAQRNKCMELDKICCDCDWMAPRYTVVPSLADGMHVGEVRLRCPDFEMSIIGDPCPTPHDARCSAAANMILELDKKAEEKEQHDN
ncbi:uncharacterized protein LOC119299769 [Triticum dicoccoides]|uniref:uncharacterized protein LOC119299769 n=1 Tax=Triticum dicoccoides TaxID=85692 RepID=UPI00188EACAB|nr:uncharacterized protein LOC119299769 [Triticum dicoccoides]